MIERGRRRAYFAYLRKLPAITVLISVLLAFGFRVLPAYHAVFTPRGISFEEPDAWFHMRLIHNLMAHFPRRSGFDPYARFPGGERVTAGPFWDYLVGSTAWIAGAGSPSDNLVDEAGTWLPAILGALLPIPVFLLARRLFGVGTGMLSALWVAIIPGTFLWVGHLGMPDHHAAEVLVSFLTLAILCAAAETQGLRRWITAALSGVALAAYLETQVTGIFVPAILALAAVFSPALASLSATALATACLLLLPAAAVTPWSGYRWLSLIGGLAIAAPLAVLHRIGRERNWSRGVLYGSAAFVAVVAIGCVDLFQAARVRSMIAAIQSFRSGQPGAQLASQVGELQPVWDAAPGGFASLYNQFGAAWMFAVPGLAGLLRLAWRGRRPSVVLFAVWSLTMIYGVISHLRMAAYTGIVVAMLAALTTAWILQRIPKRVLWLRSVAAAILILAAAALALPIGFEQTHFGQGPDPDWWAALNWLRWQTPEPMGDPLAWYRWFPPVAPGARFVYPSSAYGIVALWDKGWWISSLARRIPAANGGLSGASETARFLTETHPADALRNMLGIGARYAAIGPGSITFELPATMAMAGRRIDEYSRVFYTPGPGGRYIPVRVYLPAFFRSMAARLYLFDGRAIDTKTRGVHVFLTRPVLAKPGVYEETIESVRSFASEKEAEQWMVQHPNETATLASADATASCVDLEEIPWMKRVFVSGNEQVVGYRQPLAVKIFERTL